VAIAIERRHGGTARLRQTVPVKETHGDQTVWESVVHVFDLEGHPKATQAYAWSSPIEGSTKRRSFAVLHMGGVKSPADAVRAAIMAEQRVEDGADNQEVVRRRALIERAGLE
jgi:hypothetical protein